MDKFENFYRLLRLKPGDTWEQLRTSYKSQIRKWHPDRYVDDSADRNRAEENTKQINQAFQELGDYYYEHGRLPLDPPPQSVETATSEIVDPTAEPVTSAPPSETTGPYLRRGSRRRLILALGVIAVVVYLFWEQAVVDPGHSDAPPNGTAASQDAPPEPRTAASAVPETSAASFDVGSTLGEVYASQGVPTRVEGDTWYYGDAWVFFQNGKVVRWADTEPPRLKTSHGGGTRPEPTTVAAFFARGSTKEEVRAVQGVPLRESGTVWEYGLSRVYFDRNGLVSRWEESPLDPLRVPH